MNTNHINKKKIIIFFFDNKKKLLLINKNNKNILELIKYLSIKKVIHDET